MSGVFSVFDAIHRSFLTETDAANLGIQDTHIAIDDALKSSEEYVRI